jgi:hypothetical protein
MMMLGSSKDINSSDDDDDVAATDTAWAGSGFCIVVVSVMVFESRWCL